MKSGVRKPGSQQRSDAVVAPSETQSSPSRNWSKKEDAILRRNYTKYGSRETAEVLKRSINAVQARALRLGIPGNGLRPWTAVEVRYLEKNYHRRTAVEISKTLHRTEQSVRGKIHGMGLGEEAPDPWTERETAYLQKHYGVMSNWEIAEKLDRSEEAVSLKAARLGIREKLRRLTAKEQEWIVENLGKISYARMARELQCATTAVARVAEAHGHFARPYIRAWTPEEDKFVRENYGQFATHVLAEKLNRTVAMVSWRAGKLGLRVRRTEGALRRWTTAEDAAVRKMYGKYSRDEIAAKLGRTAIAVGARAKHLQLTGR